jgi:ABC-type Fe3+ transport system substrate-binding protein
MGRLAVSDVLVYAHTLHADTARSVLAAACAATGLGARLDVYGSGSLYQRLGPRRGQPLPDLVWWFGPFAASAAAADGLLQPHQPGRVASGAAHDPDWKWSAIAYSGFGVIGGSVARWEDLAGVPRLAIADPERSELGLSLLLASLDRARQVDGDAERGWAWWQERARNGLVLAESEASAQALSVSGQATHAVILDATGAPLAGLGHVAHAIGLAASSRNVDGARTMLDWLTSEAAADKVPGSVWRLDTSSAPTLDLEWCREQYVSARQRWAASGFGPSA